MHQPTLLSALLLPTLGLNAALPLIPRAATPNLKFTSLTVQGGPGCPADSYTVDQSAVSITFNSFKIASPQDLKWCIIDATFDYIAPEDPNVPLWIEGQTTHENIERSGTYFGYIEQNTTFEGTSSGSGLGWLPGKGNYTDTVYSNSPLFFSETPGETGTKSVSTNLTAKVFEGGEGGVDTTVVTGFVWVWNSD